MVELWSLLKHSFLAHEYILKFRIIINLTRYYANVVGSNTGFSIKIRSRLSVFNLIEVYHVNVNKYITLDLCGCSLKSAVIGTYKYE